MKTATLGINANCSKSAPLGEAEQKAICSVIQRAEQLDVTEMERVRLLLKNFDLRLSNLIAIHFTIDILLPYIF